MPVTRTNTRRYVATCPVGGCDWQSQVLSKRLWARERERVHLLTHFGPGASYESEGTTMKQPDANLPTPERERLGDHAGHLVVFVGGEESKRETKHGPRKTVETDVYTWTPEGGWDHLGATPVFWGIVQRQILDAEGEPLGGILTQGTESNPREWCLVPLKAAQKAEAKALAAWSPDAGEEPF